MKKLLLALALVAVVAATHPTRRLAAADDTSPVVLRGATIVVGNGKVIENGVVVLRGRLIESVDPTSRDAGSTPA
jgi:hypothetical protein